MEFMENEICEQTPENSLMLNTIEILDDEKQNVLTEVLRCVVCLELPIGKQVKICEKGHHFCHTCHRIMRTCGVCRCPLLESRNFVVEYLVTKLAPILDISKGRLPPPKPPYALSKGLFHCLHQCSAKVPGSLMLSHLRDHHSTNLIENVRSNPYSGKFSFTYDIQFAPNEKFIWSTQVSDMGLFTIEIMFFDNDFFGCVRMLVDKAVVSHFRYRLAAEILKVNNESILEFSVSSIGVSSYLDDIESLKEEGKGLRIRGQDLFECIDIGSPINVSFSLWNDSEFIKGKKKSAVMCLPDRCLFFKSDRKTRRNKNRMRRRKRLKESRKVVEEFSRLTL